MTHETQERPGSYPGRSAEDIDSGTNCNLLDISTAPRKDSSEWERESIEWADVISAAENPADSKECGNWLFGTLAGNVRNRNSVLTRTALTLDADHADAGLPDAVEFVLGCRAVIHSTWRSTPDDPRFRVIVALSRPVTPAEYGHLVRALVGVLGADQFDSGSAQPERFMFKPATQDPATYEWRAVDGDPLAVEAWLARPDPAPPYVVAGGAERDSEDIPAPADGSVHPYAARAVEAILAQLRDMHDWPEGRTEGGKGWDDRTHWLACNLWEFVNATWSGYDEAQARADFMKNAPRDAGFDPAEKWASAEKTTNGEARPYPGGNPVDDFVDFWDSTPVLAHIHQAARARMVGPEALLVTVLLRVLLDVPPETVLPPVIGGRAPLNLGAALVGPSGAGKSSLVSVSRELLGVPEQVDVERSLGSGEGLAATFLRFDKGQKQNVLQPYPHRFITVGEVEALGAMTTRNGSTIGASLREGLTGGSLGQENAQAERRRFVPAGAYRLVVVIGVQPTRSDVLLNDSDAGTPQRLVWVSVLDPGATEDCPPWPGSLDWAVPVLPDEVDYPDHIKAQIRQARLAQVQGGGNELDGHRLLTQLKVATALALLHDETSITDQWWALAGVLMANSAAVQAYCLSTLSGRRDDEHRARGRGDAIRREGAQDAEHDALTKAAEALHRKVTKHTTQPKGVNDQKHEPTQGCTRRCLTQALGRRAHLRDEALAYAKGEDWIREVDRRFVPGESRPREGEDA
ncbi:MAG: hypothetical protein Q4G46_00200 [Propionibacteriaceae bacterium]|nr:hypothetical protein [Propionibacteriaceae bacterium]